MLTLNEAAGLIAGASVTGDGAVRFTGVSTDSRSVAAGELFVALQGDHFDGHDYLDQVATCGAVAALVSRPVADCALPCIVVGDTRQALGTLAAGWRRRFKLPVIAVTGSNGKTTTKEMIAAICEAAFGADGTLATRGNLNNDIGVPLTLLRLRVQHRVAVIELGMNHPGETEHLAQMAAPGITLITNAQREHQEFMQNVEAVAREHGLAILALPADGIAVFPSDDPWASLWWTAAGERQVIEFTLKATGATGFSPFSAAVSASIDGVGEDGFGTAVSLRTPLGNIPLTLQAAGAHNVRNAAAATAAALAARIPVEAIRQGLQAFVPVSGRMQKKRAAAGALLIDDTYNANPDSVLAAIDVLAASAGPRTLILGDMGEVGEEGPRFHAEVGHHAASRGIETFLALGSLTRHACDAFGGKACHFEDLAALLEVVRGLASEGTILVKGSRFMRMERVVEALAPSAQPIQETH